MFPENDIFGEVMEVLKAEFKCAESLLATSNEIQSLLKSEKFDQAQERLETRGAILKLMGTLDQQLSELFMRFHPDVTSGKWAELIRLAQSLKDMLILNMELGESNRMQFNIQCEEAGKKLKEICEGRTLLKGYAETNQSQDRALYQA